MRNKINVQKDNVLFYLDEFKKGSMFNILLVKYAGSYNCLHVCLKQGMKLVSPGLVIYCAVDVT